MTSRTTTSRTRKDQPETRPVRNPAAPWQVLHHQTINPVTGRPYKPCATR